LSGEITELPPPFQPKVKEFEIRETVVAPLPPPASVIVDPVELPLPVAQ